ncbi:uncharacterized protein [Dendropsophus ebraccatus]|uniref:uncharacterized protein n=1 Tax=Dendropsophus ebraccatus TaxID=150705 RepID=UPI00383140A5
MTVAPSTFLATLHKETASVSSARLSTHSQDSLYEAFASPELSPQNIVDWECDNVARSAASSERGLRSDLQMNRVGLAGKTPPNKLFSQRWAIAKSSDVRDFAQLAFRATLNKEDDLVLRNHIGIPDIQALIAPEIDPALLSITGNPVSNDTTDNTMRNIQFKIADAVGPLLLMLSKAEQEGTRPSNDLKTLRSSKMALLKATSRAALMIGQTFNYVTNIRRARWLTAAGMSDLAPKSHEFPNLETSNLFGPDFIQEVKGRYRARKSFADLKKPTYPFKKPFRTEGRSYRSQGQTRDYNQGHTRKHFSRGNYTHRGSFQRTASTKRSLSGFNKNQKQTTQQGQTETKK